MHREVQTDPKNRGFLSLFFFLFFYKFVSFTSVLPLCCWLLTITDLPGEEICNVDLVTLPYPLITLQHRIILQNENKQLLPATEPLHK